ncbi:MAG: methylmalonyl-CoA epimerase [Desulfobacterota bacterium]|nr:methylmalonyl-CoA epimerase [Thermodesulfobacteriota bacterium]
MLKKIDHIAIAVHNLEEAARFYQEVMGLTLSGVEVVTAQKTRVGFFKIGESNIELVQPTEPDSPLVKFLETKGQGIHHICFEVDDVESEVKAFLERGATMVDQKPRPGAHDSKVAFVHPKSTGGVLIELCEHPKGH